MSFSHGISVYGNTYQRTRISFILFGQFVNSITDAGHQQLRALGQITMLAVIEKGAVSEKEITERKMNACTNQMGGAADKHIWHHGVQTEY